MEIIAAYRAEKNKGINRRRNLGVKQKAGLMDHQQGTASYKKTGENKKIEYLLQQTRLQLF